MSAIERPCAHCPWRTTNQGKRTPWGFYTAANLRRLWNQIRSGGRAQSCHPTDPSHPDHRAAGAKPGSKPRECPGSVIIVMREIRAMANAERVVTPESMTAYSKRRKGGLKRPHGITYWLIERMQMGGVPFFGGEKLPNIDINDPEVSLPPALRKGLEQTDQEPGAP